MFIVRKNELKENSAFYSYMYKNPSRTIEQTAPDKWKVTSIVLFIASLLSILGALALVGAASTVFGFVLKAKGYKYKTNIIAGIIMTFFLCIYGSFAFIL